MPMDTAAPPAAGLTLLTRYVLEDRVGGEEDAPVWRGTDSRLRRAVSVLLLSGDDPRSALVRAGAQRAAAFADRRALPVLDFGDDTSTGLLAVVSDWVPAMGFGDYLAARGADLLAPHEAADVALEVARCLASAHAVGLTHGRLHPNSLLVTDSGEIRLRGLGIAGALAADGGGGEPVAAAVQADVQGVGAILYAGLTGRWPGPALDNLPAASRLASGALPWPSRVVADVPPALDDIAARTVLSCALPKARAPLLDMQAVAVALTAANSTRPVAAPRPTRNGPNIWWRSVGVVLAVLATVGIAVLGVSLASGPVTKTVTGPDAAAESQGLGLTGLPTESADVNVKPAVDEPIPVVAIQDLDPYGADKRENAALVPLAIDSKPATAWTTLRYGRADMSGKPGVGLLLDLGAPDRCPR